MTEEIKEILDTPIFIIDNEGFTVYINDKIKDYITNLQKENEKLKEIINDNMTVYLKGLEDGKDKMKEIFESVYKQRNEKAIEYIEERKNLNWYADGVFVYELLNILQGGDE